MSASSSRRFRWLLAATLLAAVALRLALMFSPDSYGDLHLFKLWASGISERGLPHAYEGSLRPDYTPVLLYPIGLSGWAYRHLFSPAFSLGGETLTALIKLPWIAADLGLAALIYHLLRPHGRGVAFRGLLLYALSPAVLFAVSWAGYPDTPHALLAMGAVVLACRGRPTATGALMAAALLTKPQAVAVLPVVAVLVWRAGGFRAVLHGLASGTVAGAVIVSPFLAAGTWRGPLDQILHTADFHPSVSAWAHNLWWLLSRGYGLALSDQGTFLGPVSHRAAGAVLFATFALPATARLWWHRSEVAAQEAAAFCALAFFMFATQLHENHLFLALPLLAALAPLSRRYLVFYVLLSATFLANVALHQAPLESALLQWGLGEEVISLRRWNALAHLAIFLAWAYLLFLGPVAARRRLLSGRMAAYALAPASLLLALGLEGLLHQTYPGLVGRRAPAVAYTTTSDAVFEDGIRLLGHSGVPPEIGPGRLSLTLYWQALAAPQNDYQVFVHLADHEGRVCAATDGPPVLGLAPTSSWNLGDFVTDRRLLTLPPSCAPGVYRWLVGLYRLDTMERLPLRRDSRASFVVLGESKLPLGVGGAQPEQVASASVGKVAKLEGYTVRWQKELSVTLYWRALGGEGDYTVFVHLRDENGRLLAQHDGPPRQGAYPTRLWTPGELVPDEHRLPLDGSLPQDGLALSVGMYDPRTLERLPVTQDSVARAQRAVLLPLDAAR